MCGEAHLQTARSARLLLLVVLAGIPSYSLAAGSWISGDGREAQVALEIPPETQTVTGTLAMLDIALGKGMLKTDLDKPIFFSIGHPDQFSRLSIGDRVTMQLDERGQVMKVIETLPSELHEPPPPSK